MRFLYRSPAQISQNALGESTVCETKGSMPLVWYSVNAELMLGAWEGEEAGLYGNPQS